MEWRKRWYVEPELQFPMIAALTAVTVMQGLVLGWGFYKLLSIAKQWERAAQVSDFFLTFLFVVIPAVLISLVSGAYLSYRVAEPVARMRKALSDIERGDLEAELPAAQTGPLQGCLTDFNRMLHSLRTLLYRDHRHAQEVNELVSQIQKWGDERRELPDEERKRLRKLVNDCKSRLSIINAHFMKGKKELR
ncbi:MAG: hypothetical protein WCU88_04735 [Elusimicrobiota bacterium]|jgi:methyl-accepting chemotaxis protein